MVWSRTSGSWAEPSGRLEEAAALGLAIEQERGCGDDVDIDSGEFEAAMPGHAGDAFADDGVSVLGEVDEDGAGPGHGERIQARSAGGDAEGQVEAEPGFGALGGAADDADGGVAPELCDEPALGLVWLAGNVADAYDRQERVIHGRHVHTFAFFLAGWRGSLA